MKRLLLFVFLMISISTCLAQTGNLWNDVYWQAIGNHIDEEFGFSGLDTIGYINDTIRHALSIGADGGASYVFNRKPIDSLHPDTTRQYKFPGQKVIRCNLNGDSYPDFVVWDISSGVITILFGTAKIDSFKTELVLHESKIGFEYIDGDILVSDCDGDGLDDIILSERNYSEDNGITQIGIIKYYKGGTVIDSVPTETLKGKTLSNFVGGKLAIGKIRNSSTYYLIEARWYSATYYSDTVNLILYPIGNKFHLIPIDTIVCNTTIGGAFSGGFLITHVNADSIDDILLGGSYGMAMAYYGGATISQTPSFIFHRPFDTQSSTFGEELVDIGDITGHGYHSLLVTDPQALLDNAGGVFVYNMEKALQDSCVASAVMDAGSFAQFGIQAIALGDVNGDGLADFAVAGDEVIESGHGGQVYVFLGNKGFGSEVEVKEKGITANMLSLDQNYPNPFSSQSDIFFSIHDSHLYGLHVSIDLYNMLGEKVEVIYNGKADGFDKVVHVNGEYLPCGNYYYQLICGGMEETRMMTLVK